jgi:hypothetical protein
MFDLFLLIGDDGLHEITDRDHGDDLVVSFSTTGRCRNFFSVISSMHDFTVWSLLAVLTSAVIISATEVSCDDRPLTMTLRA